MTHEVETVSDTEVTLRVTVSAEQIEAAVERELKELGRKVKVPGFRPGKIPQHILRKKYGASVDEEARQKILQEEYRLAIDENDLEPVEPPTLKEEDLETDENGALRAEFRLEVLPSIELGNYRGFHVTPPAMELTAEDVDRELEQLRQQGATADLVSEPAVSGDLVVADLAYSFLDGSVLPPAEQKVIDTGNSTVDGIPAPEAMQHFLGAQPGAEIQFNLELPEDHPHEEHRGRTSVVKATVKEIRRVSLPALDDPGFLKNFQVDTTEDLRQRVEKDMEARVQSRREKLHEDLLVEQLVETNLFALPEGLLQRNIDGERDRIRKNMEERGSPPEEVERQLLEAEGQVREQTERRLRESILLDRVAKSEELEVENEDIERHFQLMSMAMRVPAQQLFDHFMESGSMQGILDGLRRDKARRFLRTCTSSADERDSEPTETPSQEHEEA